MKESTDIIDHFHSIFPKTATQKSYHHWAWQKCYGGGYCHTFTYRCHM